MNEIRQAQFKPFSTLFIPKNGIFVGSTPDTALMLPKKRTLIGRRKDAPSAPVPEIVTDTRNLPVNYDWSAHSFRPPFAFRRDDQVAKDTA